jgi:hypothetical protein
VEGLDQGKGGGVGRGADRVAVRMPRAIGSAEGGACHRRPSTWSGQRRTRPGGGEDRGQVGASRPRAQAGDARHG